MQRSKLNVTEEGRSVSHFHPHALNQAREEEAKHREMKEQEAVQQRRADEAAARVLNMSRAREDRQQAGGTTAPNTTRQRTTQLSRGRSSNARKRNAQNTEPTPEVTTENAAEHDDIAEAELAGEGVLESTAEEVAHKGGAEKPNDLHCRPLESAALASKRP